MINCMCVVQEGQEPDRRKSEILGLLNSFTNSSFGLQAQVSWVPVAAGSGFTAGNPSTSSVVAMTADSPLDSDRRENLLREFVDQWTKQTGCSIDEIVAVISDPTPS